MLAYDHLLTCTNFKKANSQKILEPCTTLNGKGHYNIRINTQMWHYICHKHFIIAHAMFYINKHQMKKKKAKKMNLQQCYEDLVKKKNSYWEEPNKSRQTSSHKKLGCIGKLENSYRPIFAYDKTSNKSPTFVFF